MSLAHALVTCASGGIARAPARQGADVIINGMGDAAAQITGANLSIDGGWTAE